MEWDPPGLKDKMPKQGLRVSTAEMTYSALDAQI